MKGNIEKFFISDNEIHNPEELDYRRVNDYIRAAEAFSRTTYQSVYIIDYFKKKFLYVSPNPMVLGDLSPEEMMELGYQFYINFVPEEEKEMLLTINKAGFAFFNDIAEEVRDEWYITYDFHIISGDRKILINHKLTPLVLTSDGRIWLALCVVSASTHTTAGHVEIHHSRSQDYYEYNLTTHRWVEKKMPTLSTAEKNVITLSIQGYTMGEIADKLCLSPDTIKKYRQRIYEKLNVRNISEAIAVATNTKLL